MIFRSNNNYSYSPSNIRKSTSDTTENASSSTTLTPVQLLSLAIRKRRSLMDQKHKDLRLELLHTGVIQHLCKSLGESRAAKRRLRRRSRAKRRRWDVQNTDHLGSGISSHPDSSNDSVPNSLNRSVRIGGSSDGNCIGNVDERPCKKFKLDHETTCQYVPSDVFDVSNSGFI